MIALRSALAPLVLLAVAGCASGAPSPGPQAPPPPRGHVPVPPTQPPPRPVAGFRTPQIMNEPGLAGIIREDGTALVRKFGEARLDVAEGDMRKLQFAGSACVLDVFLYPLAEGREPVATWVEARRASDGAAVDRAACARALQRR